MRYEVWKESEGYSYNSPDSKYFHQKKSKEGVIGYLLKDFDSHLQKEYGQNALSLFTVVNVDQFNTLIKKLAEQEKRLVYWRLLNKSHLEHKNLFSGPHPKDADYYEQLAFINDGILKAMISKTLLDTFIKDVGSVKGENITFTFTLKQSLTLLLPQVLINLIGQYIDQSVLKMLSYSEAIPELLTESDIKSAHTSDSNAVYIPLISEYSKKHEQELVDSVKALLDQYYPIVECLNYLGYSLCYNSSPYNRKQPESNDFIEGMSTKQFAKLTKWVEQNQTKFNTYFESKPSLERGDITHQNLINLEKYGPFSIPSKPISETKATNKPQEQKIGHFIANLLEIMKLFSVNPHEETGLGKRGDSFNGWQALEHVLEKIPLINFLQFIENYLTPQEFRYTQLLIGKFLVLLGDLSIWSTSLARLMTASQVNLTSGSLKTALNDQLYKQSLIVNPIAIMTTLPSTPVQFILFASNPASLILKEAKTPSLSTKALTSEFQSINFKETTLKILRKINTCLKPSVFFFSDLESKSKGKIFALIQKYLPNVQRLESVDDGISMLENLTADLFSLKSSISHAKTVDLLNISLQKIQSTWQSLTIEVKSLDKAASVSDEKTKPGPAQLLRQTLAPFRNKKTDWSTDWFTINSAQKVEMGVNKSGGDPGITYQNVVILLDDYDDLSVFDKNNGYKPIVGEQADEFIRKAAAQLTPAAISLIEKIRPKFKDLKATSQFFTF